MNVTRAMHLELIANHANSICVTLALRRFTARRSIPRLFSSDSFKSFKSNNVKDFFRKREIFRKFVLEGSLRWNQFCEPLISIVKSFLKKVLAKTYLTHLEVCVPLAEIENFMNFHPLTFLNEDNSERA